MEKYDAIFDLDKGNVAIEETSKPAITEEPVMPKKVNRSLKKRVLIGALALTMAATSAFTTLAGIINRNFKKVEKILNISQVSAGSGIEDIVKDYTVDGFWAKLYYLTKYEGDINEFANTIISRTGEPFENKIGGRKVTYDISGNNYVTYVDSDEPIFPEYPDIIDPIKLSELSDYELTFVKNTSYSDSEGTEQYKLGFLPKTRK